MEGFQLYFNTITTVNRYRYLLNVANNLIHVSKNLTKVTVYFSLFLYYFNVKYADDDSIFTRRHNLQCYEHFSAFKNVCTYIFCFIQEAMIMKW